MSRFSAVCVLIGHMCLVAGCEPEAEKESEGSFDGDEPNAEAFVALVGDNSLAPNSLAPNSLAPNSLAPNSLAPNSLAPSSLASLKANTADGAAARQLLKYTVSCALNSTQSFSFSWTDNNNIVHNEVYWGLLGIAPTWATSPLTDETRQRLVSGCLAARVNYYGVTVTISIRSLDGPLKTTANSAELDSYPHVEGAFWGNLFTQTPYLNACYNAANVTISRDAQRDCAVGHLDNGQVSSCGMIALNGSCDTWCQDLKASGQYYPSCVDMPGMADSPSVRGVVTTALP